MKIWKQKNRHIIIGLMIFFGFIAIISSVSTCNRLRYDPDDEFSSSNDTNKIIIKKVLAVG